MLIRPYAAVALIAASAVLACGEAPRPATRSHASPPAHPLSESQYAYVISSGLPSSTGGGSYGSDSHALFKAEQLLRAQCMRRAGFHYVHDPEPDGGQALTTFDPQADRRPPKERALVAGRKRHGFGLHASAISHEPEVNPDPNDRYILTLHPSQRARWLTAWWGGGGGCLRRVQSRLYGSPANASADVMVPNSIRNLLISQVRSEPPAVAATARWSACMLHATGRRWADESSLSQFLATRPTSLQRTAAFGAMEIDDAVAAARCGYSTGQARVFASLYVHHAGHLPARLALDLSRALAVRARAVLRARRVLG